MNKKQIENQIPWMYNDQIVTPEIVPEGVIGIVYKISKQIDIIRFGHYSEGIHKVYIGKKSLVSNRKQVIGKRERAKQLEEVGDKRRVRKVKIVTKDSNWMQYNSSCKPLQEEMQQSPELFRKEILYWCYNKKQMSYLEEHEMHKYNVLHIDSWNDNIAGKYYRNDNLKNVK